MKKLIVLLILVLSSGCIKRNNCPTLVEKQPLALPAPEPVDLRDVNFLVIKKNNIDKILAKQKDPVLFCVNGDGYKDLALNLKDLTNYILVEKDILEKYRSYYEQDKINLRIRNLLLSPIN